MSETRTCPDCPQAFVVLNEQRGTYICTDCAGEVGGRFLSEESEIRVFADDKDHSSNSAAYQQRNNTGIMRNGTQSLPEFGLSTCLNSRRASEYASVSRHFDGSKQKALRIGIALCSRFSACLHIPAHVSDQANRMYIQGTMYFFFGDDFHSHIFFYLFVFFCRVQYIFFYLYFYVITKKAIKHDLIKRKPEETMMACLILSAKNNKHEVSIKGNKKNYMVHTCAFMLNLSCVCVCVCFFHWSDACSKLDMQRKYIMRRWKEIKRIRIHHV